MNIFSEFIYRIFFSGVVIGSGSTLSIIGIICLIRYLVNKYRKN